MNRVTTLMLLLAAAAVEAGGDAAIRVGIRRASGSGRVWAFVLGAGLLFAYGWTVNASDWDFGRLLGLYVVFFFVVAQAISWAICGNLPSFSTLIGGALIIAGGIVITL
jgi:drug/metabolite transporter superfamily protein YnfA